ncbi:polyA polymerase catalytic subunit [Equine molluscum contagiosum-like virus]|nr:polyA polymerase catalytic subunit [Equine molluscum contagiosum-like virus]
MNEVQFEVLSEYLGRAPTLNQYFIFKPWARDIKKIVRFDKDLFFALVRKSKKRFFARTGGSAAEINARVLAYFEKQRGTAKIGRILSIIEFQTILVTSYTEIMGVLTLPAPATYHSVMRLHYASMERFAEEVLWSYNVAFRTGKVMARHSISDLVVHVNKLMGEYLRRHNKTCICYGSYSLHLLNHRIEYGDIDILQTNARVFLINLAFLIYFITGRHVVLLKVPYLKNYIVMQDETSSHIIDSFNIRQATMQSLPKVLIDNIYIIDPCVQLMNTIKMFSQIDRLEDLAVRLDKMKLRLATLLEYTRFHHNISFGASQGLRMPMVLDAKQRLVTVDTRNYGLGYRECRCYLDEARLLQDIAKFNVDSAVVDFEAVSNSVFLLHKGIMYTYFSNTVLLRSEAGDIHDVSVRALCAHLVLYHLLVGYNYQEIMQDLLASLVSRDRCPIVGVVARDKKVGRHGVIDLEKDVITH